MGKVFLWCTAGSEGAVALRDAIRELGVACRKARTPTALAYIRKGDVLVNWGPPYKGSPPPGVKVLNGAAFLNKRSQLRTLLASGVRAPKMFSSPGPGRVGRSLNHQEGSDLLGGHSTDYFVEKVPTEKEFRIHVFGGKSIRAGMKVPRRANPHPWVRSYSGGWHLDYGPQCQENLTPLVREEAKKAVKALGLDFGAVDVAIDTFGRPVVWEVNTRPGLEGKTIRVYRDAILGVMK